MSRGVSVFFFFTRPSGLSSTTSAALSISRLDTAVHQLQLDPLDVDLPLFPRLRLGAVNDDLIDLDSLGSNHLHDPTFGLFNPLLQPDGQRKVGITGENVESSGQEEADQAARGEHGDACRNDQDRGKNEA
jgi:hypothetical protein